MAKEWIFDDGERMLFVYRYNENSKMAEFRHKYPEYNNLGDLELAKNLHEKYYADTDFQAFCEALGVTDHE